LAKLLCLGLLVVYEQGFDLGKRVWQIDPLRCPSYGVTMKIVSVIEPTPP